MPVKYVLKSLWSAHSVEMMDCQLCHFTPRSAPRMSVFFLVIEKGHDVLCSSLWFTQPTSRLCSACFWRRVKVGTNNFRTFFQQIFGAFFSRASHSINHYRNPISSKLEKGRLDKVFKERKFNDFSKKINIWRNSRWRKIEGKQFSAFSPAKSYQKRWNLTDLNKSVDEQPTRRERVFAQREI